MFTRTDTPTKDETLASDEKTRSRLPARLLTLVVAFTMLFGLMVGGAEKADAAVIGLHPVGARVDCYNSYHPLIGWSPRMITGTFQSSSGAYYNYGFTHMFWFVTLDANTREYTFSSGWVTDHLNLPFRIDGSNPQEFWVFIAWQNPGSSAWQSQWQYLGTC